MTYLPLFVTLVLLPLCAFMAQNTIRKEGTVLESLPNTQFKVELQDDKRVILAYLAGKMRVHFIRILPGDRVTVELVSESDTRGRIVYRTK